MSNNVSDDILKGLSEAIDYTKGRKTKKHKVHKLQIKKEVDVRALRKRLDLSREEFAAKFGLSARTIQHWEQGNRAPQGPAKVLLALIDKKPDVINILN